MEFKDSMPREDRDWEGLHGARQTGEHIVKPYSPEEVQAQIEAWGQSTPTEINPPDTQGEDNGTE